MPLKLGILAGHGPLPPRLISTCRASGREMFIVAFEGETDPEVIGDTPHIWTRLGAVGAVLKALRDAEVGEVCLCGKMRRPELSKLKFDWRGVKLLGRLARATTGGDDALFNVIVEELESEGFRIVGADELLSELLAPAGVLGVVAPDARAREDIEVGVRAAREVGARDLGQGAVVESGVVLDVEGTDGTDALLSRCAERARPGGVLVKVMKPHQERRVDLPTIGIETIRRAHAAGLSGIAVEAGRSLIIDLPNVRREADEAGLFLVGIEVDSNPA